MTRSLPRAVAALQIVGALAIFGLALHLVLPDSGNVSWFFDHVVYYGIEIVAVVLVVSRALTRRNRVAWAAIAVAMSSYVAGELLWLVLYSGMETPPYPSWADLFAVLLGVVALAGVVARLGLTFRENRDLLTVALHDSVTDPVTELGNRRRLVADLEHVAAEATLEQPWVLVIFDLDGFKGYNDAFGHPAGDQLLARLGAKLSQVGDEDVRGYRLGGDEFCLLRSAPESMSRPSSTRRLWRSPSTVLASRWVARSGRFIFPKRPAIRSARFV